MEKQKIRFFVAECMEFKRLGEYIEVNTMEEAFKIYNSIPPERLNGGKGIGFILQKDGDEEDFGLFINNFLDKELVFQIFGENPLIKKAVFDLENLLKKKNSHF